MQYAFWVDLAGNFDSVVDLLTLYLRYPCLRNCFFKIIVLSTQPCSVTNLNYSN